MQVRVFGEAGMGLRGLMGSKDTMRMFETFRVLWLGFTGFGG